MATHSSILAWEILWTEEPGRLQSMGLQRVRHDLVTKPPPQGHHSILHDNVSLNPWESKGFDKGSTCQNRLGNRQTDLF